MAMHTHSSSPLVINIARLSRQPGSMITFHETVPSPSRMGVALMAIEKGAPLELNLRMESVSEGVLVTGTATAPTAGECARCLTAISGDLTIDLTELFAYPDSTTEATTEADEVGRIGASGQPNTIDLEQPIVDAVGLALPFSPLCGPDCQGLCPDCGTPMATAEPGHHHERIDPRWAKLSSMLETDDK
ncbi:hypothetical protein CQY20_03790 [Mycolicibacterium agri]|uniref:DNA-binding protein n=1 Tax=Mycolicibacterium agri TaxID=36811 RepID=A0A2A7NDW1_MYCAG|nr:DUF177 domain-containing protein [Mycolicibacterium agri]PEG42006.1 hypothetical protein CQY20_03790 [Mycolicibacterium agri]GFG49843.1 DNA-binding protein [Mycolicibacterium agri]